MNNTLKNNERVFELFEKICSIPHGSGNMEKISKFCTDFAEKLNLEWYTDDLHNVIIKKPASNGYEDHNTVILQGHLDMVCEKDPDVEIDFENDPISTHIDGDFITAEGTTLGGDNGIAVAMILAILESKNLVHPPVEAVFTVDEETGMYGAIGLDTSLLNGKTLINIDSEEEGVLTVGCAGGARAEIALPLFPAHNDKKCYKIIVSGLNGGHSGVDIDKGGLNADKVMGELLGSLDEYNIVSLQGGLKDNAIPRECVCVIATDSDPTEKIEYFLGNVDKGTDDGLTITVEQVELSDTAFDNESSIKLVGLLRAVPNGIISMDKHLSELVETSLNLGILSTENNVAHLSFSLRSSVNSAKNALSDRLKCIADEFGADYETHGHYPPWEFSEKSHLRDVMISTYKDLYNKEPQVVTIHAGLECGVLSDKIKGLDCVSFGPDMFDIHTSRERLSISSVKRTFNYLCNVLSNL